MKVFKPTTVLVILALVILSLESCSSYSSCSRTRDCSPGMRRFGRH
jgi:hypothetical protein